MQTGKQAIVIGGGIAGLLAVRVLTEQFEHVLLIERDHYPDDPIFRAGAPQGRHVHIMLLRGQPALYDVLKTAQPLTPIYGYRRTENRLRHFERLRRLPENFVALGPETHSITKIDKSLKERMLCQRVLHAAWEEHFLCSVS